MQNNTTDLPNKNMGNYEKQLQLLHIHFFKDYYIKILTSYYLIMNCTQS